ncbi:hypothetical protein PPERSA_10297 [Pseudocohnilembus persalinus]|uniref:Poly(A) RNA polymerase mitochondrial-like central palm domain-containing protein n=1 Tax=Pseudocohnilembus persalinus TaxID=266149 RepID=A0A0V0R171_PSEPJ|nr:hypothetical protein PPERSA_10297 [Pseudocohnilembus persalinus]|eukprot:KRX07909.1 hypothetical protein PPERSA_10297 [Pseudocohnilembus persalinus]
MQHHYNCLFQKIMSVFKDEKFEGYNELIKQGEKKIQEKKNQIQKCTTEIFYINIEFDIKCSKYFENFIEDQKDKLKGVKDQEKYKEKLLDLKKCLSMLKLSLKMNQQQYEQLDYLLQKYEKEQEEQIMQEEKKQTYQNIEGQNQQEKQTQSRNNNSEIVRENLQYSSSYEYSTQIKNSTLQQEQSTLVPGQFNNDMQYQHVSSQFNKDKQEQCASLSLDNNTYDMSQSILATESASIQKQNNKEEIDKEQQNQQEINQKNQNEYANNAKNEKGSDLNQKDNLNEDKQNEMKSSETTEYKSFSKNQEQDQFQQQFYQNDQEDDEQLSKNKSENEFKQNEEFKYKVNKSFDNSNDQNSQDKQEKSEIQSLLKENQGEQINKLQDEREKQCQSEQIQQDKSQVKNQLTEAVQKQENVIEQEQNYEIKKNEEKIEYSCPNDHQFKEKMDKLDQQSDSDQNDIFQNGVFHQDFKRIDEDENQKFKQNEKQSEVKDNNNNYIDKKELSQNGFQKEKEQQHPSSLKENLKEQKKEDLLQYKQEQLKLQQQNQEKDQLQNQTRKPIQENEQKQQQQYFISQQEQKQNQVESFEYEEVLGNEQEISVFEKLKQNLSQEFFSYFNKGFFVSYGSFSNGLGTQKSDVDATLLTSNYVDQRQVLDLMAIHLKECYDEKKMTVLTNSQINVPLIKLVIEDEEDGQNEEIEICCNNQVGYINSQLIAQYTSIDDKVKQLIILVKHWAKIQGIQGQKQMASYTLVLLTINYLQYYGLLPYLQKKIDPKIQLDKYDVQVKRVKQEEEKFCTNFFYEKNDEIMQCYREVYKQKLAEFELIELFLGFFVYINDIVFKTHNQKSNQNGWNSIPDYKKIISITYDCHLSEDQQELCKIIQKNIFKESCLFNLHDPYDVEHNPGDRPSQPDKKKNIEKEFQIFYNIINSQNIDYIKNFIEQAFSNQNQ